MSASETQATGGGPLSLPPDDGRTLYFEVLQRDGTVHARTPIRHTPFTVGRAYDNQVIIDDPFVAPHHLRIDAEPDGALTMRDLTTVNGLTHLDGPRPRRVPRLPLEDNLQARIGQTVFRVRSSAFTVPAERPLGANHWIDSAAVAITLVALVAAFGSVQAWINAGSPRDTDSMFSLPLLLVAAAALWGGGWALLSRLFVHRAHFSTHVAIGAFALLVSEAINVVLDTVAFALGSTLIAGYAYVLLFGALGVAVYAHLGVVLPGLRRRRWVIAAVVGALAVCIPAMRNVQHHGSPDRATFLATLSWPWLLLRTPVSEDTFFDAAKGMKVRVDSAVGDVGAENGEAEE